MEIKTIAAQIRFSTDQLQKVSLFDSSKYVCDLYCLKPGQEEGLQKYPESDKIYVVMRGKGWFHIGGEDRGLSVGEAVLARAGKSHRVTNASTDDLVLLVFMSPQP
jgi:mannose-6-phosphate isomerase-like protein (cupin superfamily)